MGTRLPILIVWPGWIELLINPFPLLDRLERLNELLAMTSSDYDYEGR